MRAALDANRARAVLQELMEAFDVSFEMTLYRMQNLGFRADTRSDTLTAGCRRNGWTNQQTFESKISGKIRRGQVAEGDQSFS
jgi:hypothetical protein